MGQPVKVSVHETLDPEVRRFEVNRWLTGMGGGLYFAGEVAPDSAPKPPRGGVVGRILELDGIRSVYVYGNEVTVTADTEGRWHSLDSAVTKLLADAYRFYGDEVDEAV